MRAETPKAGQGRRWRAWFAGDRRGSVSVEALLTFPFIVAALLMGIYVNRAMHERAELVQATRVAANGEALLGLCTDGGDLMSSLMGALGGSIGDNRGIVCSRSTLERDAPANERFWRMMDDAVRAGNFANLLTDVNPTALPDVVLATGAMQVRRLEFGSGSEGLAAMTTTHATVEHETWTHGDSPWDSGLDPILWRTLQQQGTWQLYPNVFRGAQ